MAITRAKLNSDKVTTVDDKDLIIITQYVADIPGGVVLDTTGVTGTSIPAGTIVYKDGDTYKPCAVSTSGYTEANTALLKYVGITTATVLKRDPRVSVLTQGQVNGAALPYAPNEHQKKGLPHIEFLYI